MKTLKEILINAGIKESEIDNYCSDLYVKVTDISKKVINSYEYKQQVTTFTDNIEHKLWYDIPFGYTNEDYFIKHEYNSFYKIFKLPVSFDIFKKDLLKYFTLEDNKKILTKLEKVIANREKEILNNYDSMEMEGTTILNIYSKDNEHGFGIDARISEGTFGEIVC